MPKATPKYTFNNIAQALEFIKRYNSIYAPIDSESPPAIKQIAAETTPGTLDHADFFSLLAGQNTCSPEMSSTCAIVLRTAIDLPPEDPDGVVLKFETIKIDANSNIAMVRILPKGIDKNQKPDLFVGGLFHHAGVYLDGAVPFAKKEKRELIVVDVPGVGGSSVPRNQSVSAELLTDKLGNAITRATNGNIRYLMGHSLGSAVIRDMFLKDKDKPVKRAELYIPIGMIPAAEEELAGFEMNRNFSQEHALRSLIFGWGEMSPLPSQTDKFFGTHPENEKKWLAGSVSRQRFPVNIVNFMSFKTKNSQRSLLEYLGHKNLVVVHLGSGRENDKDKLMELSNPKEWRCRGVIFLTAKEAAADHSSIAGKEHAKLFWESLSDNLKNRPDLKLPYANIGRMMRHPKFNMGLQASGEHSNHAGITGNAGLYTKFSYGLGGRFAAYFGADLLFSTNSENRIPLLGRLGISATPFGSLRLYVTADTEMGLNIIDAGLTSPRSSLGFGWDVENVSQIELNVGVNPLFMTKKGTNTDFSSRFLLKWPLF